MLFGVAQQVALSSQDRSSLGQVVQQGRSQVQLAG